MENEEKEELKVKIYRVNNWINVEFSRRDHILVCAKTFGYGLFRIMFGSKLRNVHWESAIKWAKKQIKQINTYSNAHYVKDDLHEKF